MTAKFQGQAEVPVEMLAEWLDESFRAIAPKQVLAKLASSRSDSVPAKPKRAAGQRRKKPAR